MAAVDEIDVTVRLENERLGIWLATATWHGLRWKGAGDTRAEAVLAALGAAETQVWKGKPMQEAPNYQAGDEDGA